MRTIKNHILILACCLLSAFPFGHLQAEGGSFTVVIDPGHGGRDPGALGRKGKEKAINRIKLIEADRPGYNIAEKLLEENWISNAKKALLENCNLGNLSTMNREEVGKVISSQIEFEKVFKQQAPKQQAPAMVQEVVPVKTNEIQGNVLG